MSLLLTDRDLIGANGGPPIEVIWEPIPNSSQELAIDTRADVTLYHGARGPGKTITQLMRFRSRVGQGYGSYWRGVIFDREYKNLGDIIAQSQRFFPKFDDGCKFLSSNSDLKWVWPTGEELLFRYVKRLSDYDGYHGHEYPFIGWNELTKQPTSELYDKLMSCNRSSYVPEKDGWVGGIKFGEPGYPVDDLPKVPRGPNGEIPEPIPLEVFATTNPSGPGHNWVKYKFITPAPNGRMIKTESDIFNPKTQQQEIITKTQVAIFGSYRENIYLDPKYVAELDAISDENLRRAWLFGDWDVVAGGALDDVWKKTVHVLPRFKVPRDWRIDRALDWGSTHPASVGWFAECNGEEITLPDGRIFRPSKGSLIQIGEIYLTKGFGTNQGLKMSAPDLAVMIKDYETALEANGWICSKVWAGPADNQIRDVRESDVDTIEKKMADKGITFIESDKSPGSRKNGLQLIRDRLEAGYKEARLEDPGLYFMDNCRASIETIPALPRDEEKPDDIDTTAEDHAYDMVRYRVLKGANRIAKTLNITFSS